MEEEALRLDIIRPALKITNLWSMSAENLLVGTASVESGLNVLRQRGGGGAISFYQVEVDTYKSITKYLNTRQSDIRDLILTACYLETFPDASAMIWNLRLATLIARCVYYRRPEPLPDESDSEGLCNYYLKYYNTRLGKSTFDKSIPHFIF